MDNNTGCSVFFLFLVSSSEDGLKFSESFPVMITVSYKYSLQSSCKLFVCLQES